MKQRYQLLFAFSGGFLARSSYRDSRILKRAAKR